MKFPACILKSFAAAAPVSAAAIADLHWLAGCWAGHDLPQRVSYRCTDADGLPGRIEGQSDGKPLSVDFPMDAAPCPGVQP